VSVQLFLDYNYWSGYFRGHGGDPVHDLVAERSTVRVVAGEGASRPEPLAVEEPLELRVSGEPLTITMRTPGHDLDLAAGFLVSEGAVRSPADIVSMRHLADAPESNVLDVSLSVPAPRARAFGTTSACGMCGAISITDVERRSPYSVSSSALWVPSSVIASLPFTLRASQEVFELTGGLHAAGLFTSSGELVCIREDVGRHNAVDKVVGWALREGMLPLSDFVLVVSGRASFELVQKAWLAGIPMLAAVSAPSSLAVDLANRAGMTLIGFLRGDSMNVYSSSHRVIS
jgi:FdhD protein